MPAVHLGRLELHWCPNCNVPLLNGDTCGICSQEPDPVKVTPPGDVRPAFEYDIELIRKTIDLQWGDGYSERIFSENKIVLLNSCPNLDRMDEVIVDGRVVGTLRYDLRRRFADKFPYQFILRRWDALPTPEKGYVLMDKGAVKPIKNGASALAVGIMEADEDIEPEDEVLILDPDGRVIATGPSYRDGKELLEAAYGKGVKVRWKAADHRPKSGEQDWDLVLKANDQNIGSMVDKAIEFIEDKVKEISLPTAVSYSGGKDSLATLLLVIEAGIDTDMLFVDTGIELPETIENVRKTAERYDLNLKTKTTEGGYWDSVEYFGPSARDYRWCCKTCKLGPIAGLIKEEYKDGVLSFIGQRRYESENRMQHGDTWDNPWIPGQVGTSPIQNWTALHVWMYLFSREAEYNPWYERGFERIGCWLCPASDLAELEILRDNFEEYQRFEDVLKEYSQRVGLYDEWIEYGMWRWLQPPGEMIAMLEDRGVVFEKTVQTDIKLPDKDGILSDERTVKLIDSIGKELSDKELGELYLRANHCVECGICAARCPQDAIVIEEGITIDCERCDSCGVCISSKCPVLEFKVRSNNS